MGVRPRTLRPETEAPARPSPHTTDRTTPERGTALTALTPTVELAAAHAATRPFVKGEEIHPVSWKLAGSPVLGSGRSRTTGPVLPRPATTAARLGPAAAIAAATAATVAAGVTAGVTAGATAGAGAGAGAGAAARAGAGAAAGVAPAVTTVTTAAAAMTAPASEWGNQHKQMRSPVYLTVLQSSCYVSLTSPRQWPHCCYSSGLQLLDPRPLTLSNTEPGSKRRDVF